MNQRNQIQNNKNQSSTRQKKEIDEEYEKLKKSKFKQQKMWAWRPNPKIATIAIVFISFGVVLIIIGIVILIYTKKIKEIDIRYDNRGECEIGKTCNIVINIDEDMKDKIFIYYQIYGLNQNHKRYMESKSADQLQGKTVAKDKLIKNKDCYPVTTNEEMGFKKGRKSITGKDLDMNEAAVPCGLMAKTYFTDNFTRWEIDGEEIFPNVSGIVWKEEKKKFKNTDSLDKQWVNMTDEHFIIWMRTSPLGAIKKIWGRFDNRNFKIGQRLVVTIENNYNVERFNGEKHLIITTLNALGGQNMFLGICYCIVGALAIVVTVIFIICYSFHIKKMTKID